MHGQEVDHQIDLQIDFVDQTGGDDVDHACTQRLRVAPDKIDAARKTSVEVMGRHRHIHRHIHVKCRRGWGNSDQIGERLTKIAAQPPLKHALGPICARPNQLISAPQAMVSTNTSAALVDAYYTQPAAGHSYIMRHRAAWPWWGPELREVVRMVVTSVLVDGDGAAVTLGSAR